MMHILHALRKFKQELFILLLSTATILAFIPVFTYLYFAHDLKKKESIMNRNDTGVVLLDRHDRPFFTFYQAKAKTVIPLSQIPKQMLQAIITAEDKEFYSHPGFSLRGILRSLFLDLKKGNMAYGGSTITQQLVKNVLLHPEKSVLRKYQEIVLAQEIERRFNKDQILEMYLNSVYFGEGAFGVENAAQTFFGKDAKQLTLGEASLLAAVLPSPSTLSPLSGGLTGAKNRQGFVLSQMVKAGFITKEQKVTAIKEKLVFNSAPREINAKAAHFALYVKDLLIKKFGEERISRSGFRVKTTLDLTWQAYAERAVQKQVAVLVGNKVTNGAAVVVDPRRGEILTMVGSKDWFNDEFGKVNITTSARPPGSAFKPLIYAAAFEERLITPATILRDVLTTFPGNYRPQDYDRKTRGQVLARRALANSLNIPSVEVMQKVGVERGLAIAKRLGIHTLMSPSDYGLSLVLGTGDIELLELTNAYAAFAGQGQHFESTAILLITDKNGDIRYAYTPRPKRVLSEDVAFLISSILSDNKGRAEVFGNSLTISRPAAVKTGTTEDYKDAWTIGYTPRLVIGVWVGNNDNTAMDQVAGSLGAAPIWKSLMEEFSKEMPVEEFIPPATIAQVAICRSNGLRAIGRYGSSSFVEYFLSGTEPTGRCVPARVTSPPIVNSRPSIPSSPGQQFPKSTNANDVEKRVREQIKKQMEQLKQNSKQN